MNHRSVVTILVTRTMYTKICAKEQKRSKINDFNSPRNKLLIVLDYFSNKIEEDFYILNPESINPS